MEIVNFDDLKQEAKSKKNQFKWWFNEQANKIHRFYVNNKELVIAAVPIVGGGAIAIIKSAIKSKEKREWKKEKRELKDLKELYVWDNRMGVYWKIRRPMTNSERLYLEQQVKERRENMGQVLSNLRLL